MQSFGRSALIIVGALLVLLLATSPARPPQRVAARAVAGGTAAPARPTIAAPTRPAPTAPLATRPLPTATIAPPTPLPTPSAPTTPLGRTLDAYLRDLVQAGLFQGSVLVARDGQIVLDAGYGYANAARQVPNTPQTQFQLASMTKQFTALAVLQLVARGQLHLDDTLCGYVDDCPAAWQPITIAQLLSHTSGLPNYTDFASFDASQMLPATPAELVARFRDEPLLFTPGSAYMYENSDYVLLGLVIERVSGMAYTDFLSANIFAPLGMSSTGAGAPGGPGQALGYRVPNELALPLDPSTLFAAGELHSTTHDLFLWDQALYTEQLLPQALRDTLWQPGRSSYGFGWKIGDQHGHRRLSHAGLMDGFASAIARYPGDRVTVIVLGNMAGADAEGIASYLADLVFGSA